MAYDPELADCVALAFDRAGKAHEAKKMMGGLCFMVNGKMCVCVEAERLMVRIGPDAYEEALKLPECTLMDFTGKPLKGFVYVDGNALRSEAALDFWIKKALDYNPIAKKSPKRTNKNRS